MACLTDNQVVAVIGGLLPSAQREVIVLHLVSCPPCQDLVGIAMRTENGEPPPMSNRPWLAHGTRVGRYVVTELLGAGAMGVVHAAIDPELDRKVALKLLHPHRAHGAARLLLEGKALARLSHPNVISVYDVGTYQGAVFIAMELVDGMPLSAWLHAEPRAWQDIISTYAQAGDGLVVAHAAGLVHRDFKPDNVMVGTDGRVRVVDFGLARAESTDPCDGDATVGEYLLAAPAMTRTGELVGTPAYMSPEQLAGEKADARSDQFAFSVALYEALFGARPYRAPNREQLAIVIAEERVPEPQSSVPKWVFGVLSRGLRASPAARFPSMEALLAALRAPPPRRRRVTVTSSLAVAVTVTAVVATIAAIVVVRASHAEPQVTRPPPVATAEATASAMAAMPTATETTTAAATAAPPTVTAKGATTVVSGVGSALHTDRSSKVVVRKPGPGLFNDVR